MERDVDKKSGGIFPEIYDNLLDFSLSLVEFNIWKYMLKFYSIQLLRKFLNGLADVTIDFCKTTRRHNRWKNSSVRQRIFRYPFFSILLLRKNRPYVPYISQHHVKNPWIWLFFSGKTDWHIQTRIEYVNLLIVSRLKTCDYFKWNGFIWM